MSDIDPRTQQVIAEGEAAWLKVSAGNWDESAWKIMGTALTLIRQQVLFDLGSNVARGSIYNIAFARRLDGTAFKSMDANTRSNLLFVMEPSNRVVLDRLMAGWTPSQRARRIHPTTLAQSIRTELRPPKPAPQANSARGSVQATTTSADQQEIDRLRRRIAVLEAAASAPRAQGRQAAPIDASTLSISAQQKLATAIKQHKAALSASFNTSVADRVRERLDEMILPEQRRLIADAKRLYEKRRGLMDKNTFNTIRRALHPDSRNSISDGKLGEAFDKFMRLEKYLLNEKDSPTTFGDLPSNIAEWDAMKRRATASRKATRNGVRPRP